MPRVAITIKEAKEGLGLANVEDKKKWQEFDNFLKNILGGRKWGKITHKERVPIWDTVKKYLAENDIKSGQEELNVIDKLFIKRSIRRTDKQGDSQQVEEEEESGEAPLSPRAFWDPAHAKDV